MSSSAGMKEPPIGKRQMKSRSARRAVVFAFFASYLAVAATLWTVAYNTQEDKSRAALIGIAGAVTGGMLAVIGGWFAAWRNGLEQRRQARSSSYAQVENAVLEYEEHRKSARDYYLELDDTTDNAKREYLAKRSLEHRTTATALRLQLQSFLITALYCTEASSRPVIESLLEEARAAREFPDTDHKSLSMEAFRRLEISHEI